MDLLPKAHLLERTAGGANDPRTPRPRHGHPDRLIADAAHALCEGMKQWRAGCSVAAKAVGLLGTASPGHSDSSCCGRGPCPARGEEAMAHWL